MSQTELAIFDELSNLRAEYRHVFGHDIQHEAYMFIELQDKPTILRQIIDTQDESIFDTIFPPVPVDADI